MPSFSMIKAETKSSISLHFLMSHPMKTTKIFLAALMTLRPDMQDALVTVGEDEFIGPVVAQTGQLQKSR